MRKILTVVFVLLTLPPIWSNGLSISNQALIDQVNGSHTFVQFTISWENSWNTTISTNQSTNISVHDAVWVFVKYRVATADGGDGVWRHAKLNTSGHTAPSTASIVADDDKGVFVRRSGSNTGTGNVSFTGVKLRWDYAQNLESSTPGDFVDDGDNVEVKVFGIEMAHVPSGAFYLGDGDGTNYSTQSYHNVSDEKVLITDNSGNLGSTDQIFTDLGPLATSQVKVDGVAGISTNGNNTVDNSNYPTGFNAFYIMKYEMSQQQYVDFLNTLSFSQQDANTVSAPDDPVNTSALAGISNQVIIKISTPSPDGVEPAIYVSDYPYKACGYMKWSYAKAFADWAALRPMSELEYEKACKGGNDYGFGVFPWGTSDIASSTYGVTSNGNSDEYLTSKSTGSTAGNAIYSSTRPAQTVFRVGIVSDFPGITPKPNDKEDAGSSFFGVMEMSGNVWEQVVSLSTSTGQGFNGVLGDGDLSTSPSWPLSSAVRGGSLFEGSSNLRVADRQFADGNGNFNGWTTGEGAFGFRAVR